jgi:subtilisin family serine protease
MLSALGRLRRASILVSSVSHNCPTVIQASRGGLWGGDRASGIAVVFSAGNDGPGIATSTSSNNYTETFAVGAVDGSSTVPLFSSRGPSACDGGLYPTVVAPGVNVMTADLTFGGILAASYAHVSGTSFAAPHVAAGWRSCGVRFRV